ncbi:MAG TPA: hypothetical protein VF469_34815 [Kofleriaceae bacterium]
MTYRDDLIALSARHDALAAEVAEKTRELEESRRLLEHARARAKLPVQGGIRVASPCTADWNRMTGDDRVRRCGECQKDVYNLSGMTRDEAEALLIERNGDVCVRYFQRRDDPILLADCAVGARRRTRRRWIAAGAVALAAAGAGVAGAMHRDSSEPPKDELDLSHATMGKYDGVRPTASHNEFR